MRTQWIDLLQSSHCKCAQTLKENNFKEFKESMVIMAHQIKFKKIETFIKN